MFSLSVFVSLNKPTHSFGEITTAFVWWNRQRIPYKPERLAKCKKRDLERLTDLLIQIKSYCALTTSAFHAVFTTWTERNKQSNFYSASVSQIYANGASIMERLKSNRGGYMDGRSISFTILEFLLQKGSNHSWVIINLYVHSHVNKFTTSKQFNSKTLAWGPALKKQIHIMKKSLKNEFFHIFNVFIVYLQLTLEHPCGLHQV